MKYALTFVFIALFALTMAAPADEQHVEILRQDADIAPESYKYGFETSDGTQHDEEGQLKNVGTDDEAIVVKGSYKYVGDDGVTYQVSYTADENGFQPVGEHLPKA
ncbi:PREDICTED: larval cuticle protein 8-like [Rhagoletis zephyria]|uniref:larval cuticle protein 8-like n=1 Tax=Rhagoletis zephyria TaxID=28612 RepID=UPI0008112AD6|nr:PREDICTED: larval cuticle protein 8-like [Rhagoletis zephyria]